MAVAGNTRRQLAQTLHTAYASGLLSEETLERRIDTLLGARLVDPAGLVGDLKVRGATTAWLSRATVALDRGVDRVLAAVRGVPQHHTMLLALDWDGEPDDIVIGRNRHCDLVVEGASVSRRHALLRFRDGHWILQDLESTNGTKVNGVMAGRVELRPGDLILIGSTYLQVD